MHALCWFNLIQFGIQFDSIWKGRKTTWGYRFLLSENILGLGYRKQTQLYLGLSQQGVLVSFGYFPIHYKYLVLYQEPEPIPIT